ncbi:MAG TPA: pantoate--beta-alanine ligase [Sedimentisphaerales bacterium]|nr:pantoate--beta-alanine ligase [Sedimentisphaerales bacterium]
MKTVTTIAEVREAVAMARRKGKRIGFVPTMGDLHDGHMALIAAALRETDSIVVSIFVNPAQFGPGEDYEKYTRNLEHDGQSCSEAGVDVLFAPSVQEMYPREQLTWVNVEKLSEPLCGQSRPGHFRAVATVCAKLFNIVQPDIAFFGRKDAQQAVIIKRMARDLNMPLRIVVCPTVREADGLAMSSRNKYLSAQERKDAAIIYAALKKCGDLLLQGVVEAGVLEKCIRQTIEQMPSTQIEYIGIMDGDILKPVDRTGDKTLVAVAVRIGSTRLIDNLIFEAPGKRLSL